MERSMITWEAGGEQAAGEWSTFYGRSARLALSLAVVFAASVGVAVALNAGLVWLTATVFAASP